MTVRKRIPVLLSLLLAFSCQNENKQNNPIDEATTLTRKWYTNSEDDRYFYEFKTDGSLVYRYFQNISSSPSSLNTFVTIIGEWKYLNNDKTIFSVGWNDSIDCYYIIVEETDSKLVLQKDSTGSAGRGLGSTIELFKNAFSISFSVPDEIVNLLGIWYYSDSKDGKYLKINSDGTCVYHYYQDFGTGSGLNGWVNNSGIWSYNSDVITISITMNGEINYAYIIETLDPNNLKLNGANNSMIYNSSLFYK